MLLISQSVDGIQFRRFERGYDAGKDAFGGVAVYGTSATIEGGKMTKDLAVLVGPDQNWLTTEGFIDAVDQAVVDVGIEGLKIAVTEMPGIPTYGYVGFVTWDEQYWTNWPGAMYS